MKRILVVEDDRDQAELTREILRRHQKASELEIKIVADGEEAIAHLCSEFRCWSENLPNVILLDLDLPKRDGFAVLKFIKGHRRLKRIPVVIYSAGDDTARVGRCYELAANSFIAKRCDGIPALDLFSRYWLGAVQLPQLD